MKINVGSKNQTKVQAVRDAVLLYPKLFPNPEILGLDVRVDIFGHPKNIRQIVEGAMDRASQAFVTCEVSIGLESGLMEVPHTKTGHIEIAACAIFDGKNHAIGFSSGFEWPRQVAEKVLGGDGDASQAFKQLKLTEHEKLGAVSGGIINFLTNGRITREEQTKQSIIMALIQLEHKVLY